MDDPFNTCHPEHIIYVLYNIYVLSYMVHDNRCPVYLSESVQPVSSNPVRQRLRSASSLDYIVPRTKLNLETEPSLLPVQQHGTVCLSLLDQPRLSSFKLKLKTYLFNISF